MQLQVIRNLELSIRNIHVVYEDRTTKPDHPFAFGFTLNYITLHVNIFWNNSVFMKIFYCILDNNSRLETNNTYRRYTNYS